MVYPMYDLVNTNPMPIQSIAWNLDDFGRNPGSTAFRKKNAVNAYLNSSFKDVMSPSKWLNHDTSALMGAAHLLFRHSLLDKLAFAAANDQLYPHKISSRAEMPTMPRKFREVRIASLLIADLLSHIP
jgi:hypothetical protein